MSKTTQADMPKTITKEELKEKFVDMLLNG